MSHMQVGDMTSTAAQAECGARKAAEAALVATGAELHAAEEDAARLREIQRAADASDVARRQATERRALVEADRRTAEAARMTTLHDSIGRRPAGKKILLTLRGMSRVG